MRTVYHGVHIIITRDAAPFQSLRMSVPLVDGFKPDNIFPNLDMLNVPAFCLLVVRTLLCQAAHLWFHVGPGCPGHSIQGLHHGPIVLIRFNDVPFEWADNTC